MNKPPEWDIQNVMRKAQMLDFGEMVFKIYEEQFADIKRAYEAYEGITSDTLSMQAMADIYHRFFHTLYQRVDERDTAQQERLKQMEQEHKEILKRSNEFSPAMREFIDSFNKQENNNG